jgi:hypothetical protein
MLFASRKSNWQELGCHKYICFGSLLPALPVGPGRQAKDLKGGVKNNLYYVVYDYIAIQLYIFKDI